MKWYSRHLLAAFHSLRGNRSLFSLYNISDIQCIPWAEWDMHAIPAFGKLTQEICQSEVSLGFLTNHVTIKKKKGKEAVMILCDFPWKTWTNEFMRVVDKKIGGEFLTGPWVTQGQLHYRAAHLSLSMREDSQKLHPWSFDTTCRQSTKEHLLFPSDHWLLCNLGKGPHGSCNFLSFLSL